MIRLPDRQPRLGSENLKRTVDHNLRHLRAAVERIGVEKPSDVTLLMEEVVRMEAEEKLIERVTNALLIEARENGADSSVDYGDAEQLAKAAIKASGLPALLTAASAFIEGAERAGWGETSDKALPGSFDQLVEAVRRVKE